MKLTKTIEKQFLKDKIDLYKRKEKDLQKKCMR